MEYFYEIRIAEDDVRAVINAIRLLSDPTTSSDAHITLRGPHKRRIEKEKFDYFVAHELVSVVGVGNFFEDGQTTVFLRCGFASMDDVWFKPHYRRRNGHITIYDGENIDFANELFAALEQHRIYFCFTASELIEVPDLPKQRDLVGLWQPDWVLMSQICERQGVSFRHSMSGSSQLRLQAILKMVDFLDTRSLKKGRAIDSATR